MATRRYIIARSTAGRDRAAQMNAWLHRHATLDLREGGDKTFTQPLNTTGNAADPPVAYWCCWAMPDAWWQALAAEVTSRGWGINETAPAAFDVAHYPDGLWTPELVLADTTRKPVALKTIVVEP